MKEFLVKNKTGLMVVSLLLVGTYFFMYRNRKPKLKLNPNVDWDNKTVSVKFGTNKKDINYSTGSMDAGATYSDKYKLDYYVVGNKMIFEIKDQEDNILSTKTIDFKSKIMY